VVLISVIEFDKVSGQFWVLGCRRAKAKGAMQLFPTWIQHGLPALKSGWDCPPQPSVNRTQIDTWSWSPEMKKSIPRNPNDINVLEEQNHQPIVNSN
jgi:hypothetical protein